MRWLRHGLIWAAPAPVDGLRQALIPTPMLVGDGNVRVYTSCPDSQGRSVPWYFDVSLTDKPSVRGESAGPVLTRGSDGAFDQDGVVTTSVIGHRGLVYMYYVGFKRLRHPRYRMMVGLAVSRDDGVTFERHQAAPILDSRCGEEFFRAGPFVFSDKGALTMIYAGGGTWFPDESHERPSYDLRLIRSPRFDEWREPSQILIRTSSFFYGYGRPWLFSESNHSRCFLLSVRDAKAKRYRMAWAEFSRDWKLIDFKLGIGLEPTGKGYERENTVFPATIKVGGKTWCFYNGDGLGKAGILLAELDDDD